MTPSARSVQLHPPAGPRAGGAERGGDLVQIEPERQGGGGRRGDRVGDLVPAGQPSSTCDRRSAVAGSTCVQG